MQVLELADEFNLTTNEALEICAAAGITDAGATTHLTEADAERWRSLATARRDWLQRTARVPVGTGAPAADSGASTFGPLPAAPWERAADGQPHPTTPGAPALHANESPPLGPGWGTDGSEGAPAVTPYAPAALALAVVALIFPFIPGFGALVLAWYAKDRIERSRGRLTGERLATAAQVVAAIGIALWTLLLAFTVYQDVRADADARDDGQVETGQLGWDQIGKGSCVRIPRADLGVDEWTGLDCAQPHEAEVYSTELVAPTTNPNEPYPGRGSLIPGATRLCQERFAGYVGIPYESSKLRIAVYFPSGPSWSQNDDRTIGCIVYQDEYDLIAGTLAGSMR